MIGDACEDIGEPFLWVHVVELRGLDQRVDDGGMLPAAIRAAEQSCLAAERDAALRALDGVVGEADAAIVEEARERVPALERVEAGLGQFVAARQLGDLLGEPSMELGHHRRAEFLTGGKLIGGALAVNPAPDIVAANGHSIGCALPKFDLSIVMAAESAPRNEPYQT